MEKTGNPNNRGSIIIIAVIFMTVLLGIGAIATDMAVLYAEKSRLQNAVDAAVLAGAQELPARPDSAYLAASEYSELNNTDLSFLEISTSNTEIKAAAEKEVPLYLARVFNIQSSNITAEARAAVSSVSSVTGAAPLSITMQNFVYGEEYTLKNGGGDGDHGWYGPVRLDGSGANLYRDALANGSTNPMSVGQILEIESGNMSGPTQQGLRTRLDSDTRVPPNTFEDYDRNAPQIVYIPIVETVSWQNDSIHSVKILGFAAFFIENIAGSGNDCFITGRFIQTLVSLGREASPLDPESQPSNDYGLYSVKLLMN